MTFAHPWVLLFLIAPVLLVLWVIQRRGAGLALPFDHQTHKRNRWLPVVLHAMDCAPAIALASMILILAGPQTMQQPRDERVLTNIQICMDVSGSMTVEDRYEMAKTSIEQFTLAREGDAFGLTLFGSEQIRWTPLTTDLATIRRALPFANPEWQPSHMSGTMIGAALRFCRDNMVAEATEGDRLIILVSDGYSADLGDGFSRGNIGDELAESEITVYHIHVGSAEVPQEVVDIADRTGGEAFAAKDQKGLERIFRHIDRMQPAKFKPGGTIPLAYILPFVITGLSAIAAHLAGLLVLRYTPW